MQTDIVILGYPINNILTLAMETIAPTNNGKIKK